VLTAQGAVTNVGADIVRVIFFVGVVLLWLGSLDAINLLLCPLLYVVLSVVIAAFVSVTT